MTFRNCSFECGLEHMNCFQNVNSCEEEFCLYGGRPISLKEECQPTNLKGGCVESAFPFL